MHRACRTAVIGVSSGNTALQRSVDGFDATYQAAIWARDRKPSRARIRSTWDSAERSVITSSSAICRFDQPCATSAATWSWRGVTVGWRPAVERGQSQAAAHRVQHGVRVADEGDVRPTGQHRQRRAVDAGGQPFTLGDRHRAVILAVDDRGRRRDPTEVIGDVDVVARRQQPMRPSPRTPTPAGSGRTSRGTRRPRRGRRSRSARPTRTPSADRPGRARAHARRVRPPRHRRPTRRRGPGATRTPDDERPTAPRVAHRRRRRSGRSGRHRPRSRPSCSTSSSSSTMSVRLGRPGQPAPRSVVSHERATVRQALVELALGRQRPPELEMGHPPRHVDRDRTRAGDGEPNRRAVLETGQAEPLLHEPHSLPTLRHDRQS